MYQLYKNLAQFYIIRINLNKFSFYITLVLIEDASNLEELFSSDTDAKSWPPMDKSCS